MKKRFYTLYVFMIGVIFAFLTLNVQAHPGRTDSNGGHTDHSTGEYHYHHGYPAHDHYDIDGDGDIDCLYDFDDKTDHKNNSGQSIKEESKATKGLEFGGIIAVAIYIFFMFILPFLMS